MQHTCGRCDTPSRLHRGSARAYSQPAGRTTGSRPVGQGGGWEWHRRPRAASPRGSARGTGDWVREPRTLPAGPRRPADQTGSGPVHAGPAASRVAARPDALPSLLANTPGGPVSWPDTWARVGQSSQHPHLRGGRPSPGAGRVGGLLACTRGPPRSVRVGGSSRPGLRGRGQTGHPPPGRSRGGAPSPQPGPVASWEGPLPRPCLPNTAPAPGGAARAPGAPVAVTAGETAACWALRGAGPGPPPPAFWGLEDGEVRPGKGWGRPGSEAPQGPRALQVSLRWKAVRPPPPPGPQDGHPADDQ